MDLNRLTEQSQEALRCAQVLDALRREFRPEFLNRVDEIVVFHNLSREHLKEITTIQLRRLQSRLDERHITLELTEAAREHLAVSGYDPNFGARPLKRLIQKELETALGRLILKGEVKDGDVVTVDKEPKTAGLKFSVQPHSEQKSSAADVTQEASAA
jgi:ATP-dependent Clp protease ATP-binding subunit ClpB